MKCRNNYKLRTVEERSFPGPSSTDVEDMSPLRLPSCLLKQPILAQTT